MITLKELLKLRGLDTSASIKIARHKDTRKDVDVHQLIANDEFELYQSYQEKDQFKDCKYLISCVGLPNSHALFVGVYEVIGKVNVNGFPNNIVTSFKGKAKINSRYRYTLKKIVGFEDLEGRVVVKWTEKGQAWCVHFGTSEKEVVKILPKPFVKEFPGFNEVKLYHWQLKNIIEDPISNDIWHKMLSSVCAVYLIVDTTDGQQYIGSASGKEGLLGRWRTYAQNKHGNNVKLMDLLDKEPERFKKFRFSILQVYPLTLSQAEILKEEMNYIDKLGSRTFGLNN